MRNIMSNQNTPLHTAVQNGNLDIVRMLLDAGYSPNEANGEGLTPLHIVAQTGNTEIAALLIERANKNDISALQPPSLDTETIRLEQNENAIVADDRVKDMKSEASEQSPVKADRSERIKEAIIGILALAMSILVLAMAPPLGIFTYVNLHTYVNQHSWFNLPNTPVIIIWGCLLLTAAFVYALLAICFWCILLLDKCGLIDKNEWGSLPESVGEFWLR